MAIDIRGVMSFKQLEDQKDFIRTYFRCKEIKFDRKDNGLVNIIVTYDEKD